MATRKKAPKRSKSATKRKASTKAKGTKSASAESNSKPAAKSKSKPNAGTKTGKRKTASKPAASSAAERKTARKKSTKATGKNAAKRASSSKPSKSPKSAKKATDSNSSELAKHRSGRVTKKSQRNSAPKPVAAPPQEEKPLPKTRLNDKQLAEFKQKLLDKRRMLTGDVRNLTMDALGRDGSGELSNMPIHMADIGSDNWEQEFTLGLIENEQQVVREIDFALARIADRTYGVCVATGKHIGIARLRAKPWAKYCIEYARQLEIGRR